MKGIFLAGLIWRSRSCYAMKLRKTWKKSSTDYFAAGTEQIWVLYPGLRRVHVYERPADPLTRTYTVYPEGTILQSALFPGLRINVAEFFQDDLRPPDSPVTE
jgi:Uma2 family endonuclease